MWLEVTVLLKSEPSAQSEVLNALDWVFIKAISIYWCIELFFYAGESLRPCRWKTAPQHEAATAHFTFGMVLCRWWAERVSVKHNVCNWASSNQGISFLTVWGPFWCFFAYSKYVFTEERIASDHTSIKHRWLECYVDVCPSVDFSNLHIWSWSSTKVTNRFLVTSLTKALLHKLLSLARRPVLVVPNFFH